MRYQNWDVLLFPEDSKVPIQEFKVQCHVTRDLESSFLHSSTFSGIPLVSDGPPMAQLPVLTSFVPSLVQNAPFRVSIHSWEKPKPSRMIESLVGPGDAVLFEARVYIDGVQIVSGIFDDRTVWPYVLDTSAQLERAGNEIPLKFPAFHREILHQLHWEAGELLGRIRIVISEGVSRDIAVPQGQQSYLFDRVRDVVAFSFQHAPLNILEFSGIAWPNQNMWHKVLGQGGNRGAPRGTRNLLPEDLHAHSPRHPSCGVPRTMLPPIAPGCDPTAARFALNGSVAATSAFPLTEDPFTEHRRPNAMFRRGKRSTFDDTPMPDYASSSTDRSQTYSDMTGLSYESMIDTSGSNLRDHGPSLGELIHQLSPARAREILINASTPSKGSGSEMQVPRNSISSNIELLTQPSANVRLPYPEATVEVHNRVREQEGSPESTPSSQTSADPGQNSLPKTARKHATAVGSTRGLKRAALENDELLRTRGASIEVTRATSNSFKMAASSMNVPVAIPGDRNRHRSDSNGSKRQRTSPSSPSLPDGEIGPCSPTRKTSRGTVEASTA